MQNLTALIIILLPLLIGFFIPVPKKRVVWLDRGLSWLVYVILFLIGLSLARVSDLGTQIGFISLSVAVLFACVMGANLLLLMWFDRRYPWCLRRPQQASGHGKLSVSGSVKQVICLLLGLIIGRLIDVGQWFYPDAAVKKALILLILLVGMQLRSSGINLRQVFLNRRGVITALFFTLACMCGGILFALIMPGVTISQGLAVSSGYGWYSLSSIVMSQAYGPIWGSIAMLNDLAREFFALIFIPFIMRRYPTTAVSVGGATSLDFTLPAIQSSGGIAAVPLAISFGFIVNITSPILMVFFSSMSF